ncbi:MAG: Lrp/AsnC family transcriptional regulator [Pseudomonadota bacterium]
MDGIDKRILAIVQTDADAPIAEIAEKAGLSQTPCWRRLKKLQEDGVIQRRVALLNPEKLGLPIVGYVRIHAKEHSEAWLDAFAKAVRDIPEIVECHRMTGDVDYLIKVVAPGMDGYDAIYKRLIRKIDMADVSVNFSMERLKDTTELPLTYLEGA